MKKKNLLADDVTKIVIYDEKNKKEIAVITEEAVTTANDTIVVKVSFVPALTLVRCITMK